MRRFRGKRFFCVTTVVLFALGILSPGIVAAFDTGGLKPLNSVPVPLPTGLATYVKDKNAAIKLGKALFWDQQLGGDGKTACATCHFQAGSDVRGSNNINPGHNKLFDTVPKSLTPLVPAYFPIISDDICGSMGVSDGNFLGLTGTAIDGYQLMPNTTFGFNVRQVTGRNAPSAINAIFNFRQFWDGRANNQFNGVTPFGPADQQGPVVYQNVSGFMKWVRIAIPNASLASQACGPPLSPVEMSFAGRTFPQLGRKMLGLTPLGLQKVSPTDSVLGPIAGATAGLTTTYTAMIQAAFQPQWWNDTVSTVNGFKQMELNFSMFFGLSVLLYESTLVSDQTPLDKYLAGNTAALTPSQIQGFQLYTGKGRCNKCHTGAELTLASISQANGDPLSGFINTGVRPLADDGGDILQPGQAKFKTPGLRNVELNAPYFHNGGAATLMQVVEFYNRGGDFPNAFTDGDVRVLGMTNAEMASVVDFMIAMTDERVRYEKAPFDHPYLPLPYGGFTPVVGAAGRATPVTWFLGMDPFRP